MSQLSLEERLNRLKDKYLSSKKFKLIYLDWFLQHEYSLSVSLTFATC